VLVVHPERHALSELIELLTASHLMLEGARTLEEVVHRLEQHEFEAIVIEHLPPALDARVALSTVIDRVPELFPVVLTNDGDDDELMELPESVFRFGLRGRDRGELARFVVEGVKLQRMHKEQQQLIFLLGQEREKLKKRETLLDFVVRERTKQLQSAFDSLKQAHRASLLGLAEAIEAKDPYTKGHCGRVAAYALALARAAGLPEASMESLEYASFLHDIGKIGVRDAVLLKPGPLDADEWVHMRIHPQVGADIVSQIEVLRPTLQCIRNHHERWDGGGYPDGLKGQEIDVTARIVTIVDAFDAMATDRPYKQALTPERCEEILRQGAGHQFDPELVSLFLNHRIGTLLRGS
jgi:HD-GYP domain-containing protein (c-di-GMP phosphodiesterase class II)